MSTFKGIIAEFPQIRIDYFRHQPEHKAPLACFLSHVHSDHLLGLESLRAPFVYCSAATREILLRLEKYHYRINFAKGILESRNVTYDKSMHKLAKPLPLDMPTDIELKPGQYIRVTLIDANHCVGAVMFLIEGDNKAVLYTGDIRAETWWVNSIVQNPVLLPYAMGLRRLDCIYLDTTFAEASEPYREFPSKAEGIQELLEKVSQYGEDTIFYFHSWTFGYENVWIALSAFLKSQIHLDEYRARIYGSLSTLDKSQLRESGIRVSAENKFLRESGLEIREAPPLCGFRNGNHIQPGCLTSRKGVRIHSCERGMGCPVMDNDTEAKIVYIIPIITRSNGVEFLEKGAGGGKGDLNQSEDSVTSGASEVLKLIELCVTSIKNEEELKRIVRLLQRALDEDHGNIDIGPQTQNEIDLSLKTFVSTLSSLASEKQNPVESQNRTIRFPYSRHSSYSELCGLIEAFRPMGVFPCTVHEDTWTPKMSMQNLFGRFCRGEIFRHDADMMRLYEARLAREENNKRNREDTQGDTQESEDFDTVRKRVCSEQPDEMEQLMGISPTNLTTKNSAEEDFATSDSVQCTDTKEVITEDRESMDRSSATRTTSFQTAVEIRTPTALQGSQTNPSLEPPLTAPTSNQGQLTSDARGRSRRRPTNQQLAYQAAIGTHLTWSDFGGLESTRSKTDRVEEEL